MLPKKTDVCVIGGGPAGSTAARRLAELGHRVTLIEQSPFPRRRIGESLAPSILPLLDDLGLRSVVEEAGFLRPTHTQVNWSSLGTMVASAGAEPGFHVDRGRFDALLLDAAIHANVEVIQPARAGRVARGRNGRWLVAVAGPSLGTAVEARAYVDASGRKASRGRSPRTVAVWGYWRGVETPNRIASVEAGTDAWCWGVPLPDGTFNAAVFSDAGPGAVTRYRERLRRSSLIGHCLFGVLDGRIQGCDATPCTSHDPIGPDHVRVGDASYAIDPLSSQGVQHALTSALQGSIALHTLLTGRGDAAAAIEFYRSRQVEALASSARSAAAVYSREDRFAAEPFWRRRSASTPSEAPEQRQRDPMPTDRGLRLSPATTIRETPVLTGDRIRRQPAVYHPSLPRPVAFLGNVALPDLLVDMVVNGSAFELARHWPLADDDAWEVLEWCWQAGLLEPTSMPA